MNFHPRLSLYCFVLLLSSAAPTWTFARCGVWRWDVKTAKDLAADQIDSIPIDTTIAALRNEARPPVTVGPNTPRQSPVEFRTYRIRGTLTEAKWEGSPTDGDDDYHLVIKDNDGNSMVVEIPSPACAGQISPRSGRASRFLAGITHSRSTYDATAPISRSAFRAVNRAVEVVGIGFFDKLTAAHVPRGSAPNQIELHPVTQLTFLATPVPLSGPSVVHVGPTNLVSDFSNPRLLGALRRVLESRAARMNPGR